MITTINPVQKARDRVRTLSQRPSAISKARSIQERKEIEKQNNQLSTEQNKIIKLIEEEIKSGKSFNNLSEQKKYLEEIKQQNIQIYDKLSPDIKNIDKIQSQRINELEQKRLDSLERAEKEKTKARKSKDSDRYYATADGFEAEARVLNEYINKLKQGQIFSVPEIKSLASQVRSEEKRFQLYKLSQPKEKVIATTLKLDGKVITGFVDSKGNFSPSGEDRKIFESVSKKVSSTSKPIQDYNQLQQIEQTQQIDKAIKQAKELAKKNQQKAVEQSFKDAGLGFIPKAFTPDQQQRILDRFTRPVNAKLSAIEVNPRLNAIEKETAKRKVLGIAQIEPIKQTTKFDILNKVYEQKKLNEKQFKESLQLISSPNKFDAVANNIKDFLGTTKQSRIPINEIKKEIKQNLSKQIVNDIFSSATTPYLTIGTKKFFQDKIVVDKVRTTLNEKGLKSFATDLQKKANEGKSIYNYLAFASALPQDIIVEGIDTLEFLSNPATVSKAGAILLTNPSARVQFKKSFGEAQSFFIQNPALGLSKLTAVLFAEEIALGTVSKASKIGKISNSVNSLKSITNLQNQIPKNLQLSITNTNQLKLFSNNIDNIKFPKGIDTKSKLDIINSITGQNFKSLNDFNNFKKLVDTQIKVNENLNFLTSAKQDIAGNLKKGIETKSKSKIKEANKKALDINNKIKEIKKNINKIKGQKGTPLNNEKVGQLFKQFDKKKIKKPVTINKSNLKRFDKLKKQLIIQKNNIRNKIINIEKKIKSGNYNNIVPILSKEKKYYENFVKTIDNELKIILEDINLGKITITQFNNKLKKISLDIKKTEKIKSISNKLNKLENKILSKTKSKNIAEALNKVLANQKDKILKLYKKWENLENLTLSQLGKLEKELNNLLDLKLIDKEILTKFKVEDFRSTIKSENDLKQANKDLTRLKNIRKRINTEIKKSKGTGSKQAKESLRKELQKINKSINNINTEIKSFSIKKKINVTNENLKRTKTELNVLRSDYKPKKKQLSKEDINNLLNKQKGKKTIDNRIKEIDKTITNLKTRSLELRNQINLLSQKDSKNLRISLVNIEGLISTMQTRRKQLLDLKNNPLKYTNKIEDDLFLIRKIKDVKKPKVTSIDKFKVSTEGKGSYIADFFLGDLQFTIKVDFPSNIGNLRTNKKAFFKFPKIDIEVKRSNNYSIDNFKKYGQDKLDRAKKQSFFKNAQFQRKKINTISDNTLDLFRQSKTITNRKTKIKVQTELQKVNDILKGLDIDLVQKIKRFLKIFILQDIQVDIGTKTKIDIDLDLKLKSALETKLKNINNLLNKQKKIIEEVKDKKEDLKSKIIKTPRTPDKPKKDFIPKNRFPKIPRPPEPKPPKPELPKLPNLNINFDSKKLNNRVATYEATFRERKNKNLPFNKRTNPIVTKIIRKKTTRNRMLKLVGEKVDNTLVRSMSIKVKGIGNKKKDIKKPSVLTKFRQKKSKNTPILQLVEKTKNLQDTKGEKAESKKIKKIAKRIKKNTSKTIKKIKKSSKKPSKKITIKKPKKNPSKPKVKKVVKKKPVKKKIISKKIKKSNKKR